MTSAQAASLCSDLLAAKVGFSVGLNPDAASGTIDWRVIAQPNGTVDAKQIAALEVKYGILSPVTNPVTFV